MAPPGPFAILSVDLHGDVAIAAFEEAVQRQNAASTNAIITLVGAADEVHAKARALRLRTPVLADTRGELAAWLRAERDGRPNPTGERSGPLAMITDSGQTICAVIAFTGDESFRSQIGRALAMVERAAGRTHDKGFAPVLRIPRLLDAAQCQALIDMWQTSHHPGKVGKTGQYGQSANEVTGRRICYDHFVRDPALHAQIVSTIGPRIRDAVLRACQFDVQHYEPFFVVGYPASEGGFFGAHRDNIDPAHVHRRFALTVNLNTGAYKGGGIWFPEYADTVYDPPIGEGLVFSCSILHEANLVTEATRFILSGFMWGAAEEALRQRKVRESQARRQRGTPIAG